MTAAALSRRAPKRTVRGNSYRRQGPRFRIDLSAAKSFFLKLLGLSATLVLVLGVSFAMLAGYRTLTSHPYFGLKHLDVKGTRHLEYGKVMQRAGVGLGQNTLSLNVKEIQERLAEDPWISRVAVKRIIPDTLEIRIEEKEPTFLVQNGKALFYAAGNGMPIAPVEQGRFLSLPVLRIKPGADPTDLSALVELLERKQLPFGMAEISWTAVTAGNEAQLYLGKQKLLVSVGLDSLEKDAHKLNLVWKDLNRRSELQQIDSITVFRDKIFVRMQDNGSLKAT
ncbi:MAG: cell division protein FtsQ/DivIB [Desulfovibrionales bacterium]